MLLRGALYLVIGLVLGFAHARSITEGERLYRETGERARPTLLFVIRFAVMCGLLVVVGRSGPVPLFATMIGFFLSRLLQKARPKPKKTA